MAADGVQATAGLVSRDSDREDYGTGNKTSLSDNTEALATHKTIGKTATQSAEYNSTVKNGRDRYF